VTIPTDIDEMPDARGARRFDDSFPVGVERRVIEMGMRIDDRRQL
jgi:hypothetical protein